MFTIQKYFGLKYIINGISYIKIPLVITLISFIDLKLRSGRSELRLATASSDDNFIVAWLVKNNPQEFEFDKFGQLISNLQNATPLGHLLDFILQQNMLSQSLLWSVILFLQRWLLYSAVYELSKVISKSSLIAIITVILTAGTHPYYLNLGWFGALEEQPYPMWLALPFLIYSYTKMIQQHQITSVFYAFIGLCIHPSFAFLYVHVLILFSIMKFRQRRSTFYLSISSLVLAVIYIQINSVEQSVIPVDLKKLALTNQHLNFFNPFSTEYYKNSLYIWLTLILTAVLLLKYSNLASRMEIKEPYLALIASCLGFVLFHAISLNLEISKGIAIFGPRLTVLLATIGFVHLVAAALPLFANESLLIRITAVLVCLIPSPVSIFLLIVAQIKIKRFKFYRSFFLVGYLTLFGALNIIPKLMVIAQIPESYFEGFRPAGNSIMNLTKTLFSNYFLIAANSNLNLFVFTFTFLLILMIKTFTFQNQIRINFFIFLSLVGFLLPIGISANYRYSFNGMELENVESYAQAQKWALQNTPKDSNFFIDGATITYSWRTLSNRPTINPNRIFSLYSYPEYIADYNSKWESFWRGTLNRGAIKQFGEWREPFFCESKYLMNINYILQTKRQDKLDFPTVYDNKFYTIYRVECVIE
jgi:hypothetical protein